MVMLMMPILIEETSQRRDGGEDGALYQGKE